jgi:hypothetical protein
MARTAGAGDTTAHVLQPWSEERLREALTMAVYLALVLAPSSSPSRTGFWPSVYSGVRRLV